MADGTDPVEADLGPAELNSWDSRVGGHVLPFRNDDGGPKSDALLPLEFDGEVVPQLQSRYLIKGIIGARSKIVVFGMPGSGKSFLVYDMARHIARGIDWFGHRTRRGRVVYVGAEGQAGLRIRHAAWNSRHPSPTYDPFALIPSSVDLLNLDSDVRRFQATLEVFAAACGGLDLLVIDTLAATFGGGDENGPDMARYVAQVGRLCAPFHCSSLIVTHAPLVANAKRPRGHSSLWGASDTVLQVTGDRGTAARRIHCIKQKDGDPGPDLLFKLTPLELGIDEDGDPVATCIVEQSEFDPTQVRGRPKISAKEQIVLDSLERVLRAKGRFPSADIPDSALNRTRVGKVVAMSEWRAEALAALADPDAKPDTARKAFDRARQRLQAIKIVGVWEEWVWLV